TLGAEPSLLTAGVDARRFTYPLLGLVEIDLASKVLGELEVTDRTKWADLVAVSLAKRSGFFEPSGFEHCFEPAFDPRRQLVQARIKHGENGAVARRTERVPPSKLTKRLARLLINLDRKSTRLNSSHVKIS